MTIKYVERHPAGDNFGLCLVLLQVFRGCCYTSSTSRRFCLRFAIGMDAFFSTDTLPEGVSVRLLLEQFYFGAVTPPLNPVHESKIR